MTLEFRNSKEGKESNIEYLYTSKDIGKADFVGKLQDGKLHIDAGYNKLVAKNINSGRNVVMSEKSVKRMKAHDVTVDNKKYARFTYQ